MRIGVLAPPWVAVPPPRYGGSEQVIDDLCTSLVELGHEVELFTVGTSTCPVPRSWRYDDGRLPIGTTLAELAHVLSGYERLADVDVVHDHTTLGPLVAARAEHAPPVVVTNHSAFGPDITTVFAELARTAAVVCISQAQRDSAPDVPVAAVVPHGVDLERYAYGDGGGYLAFVGRMSPDKGLDTAIRVARTAGLPLRVVSKMWEADEEAYFARSIAPLLHDGVDLLTDLSAEDRVRLVRGARALVNPIRWAEPFGLVMAESLACGTPVVALAHGAAPEIVDDGVTGFLCDDEDALTEAVCRVGTIDRRACRRSAEQRFDRRRMAADYLRVYEEVLAAPPRTRLHGRTTGWPAPVRQRRSADADEPRMRARGVHGRRDPG